MNSDVKSTRLSASGTIFGGPSRVKMVWVVGGAAAGTVTIKDGGSGGASVAVLDIPAGVGGGHHITMPEDGLRCSTDSYATLAGVGFATVFYA